MWDLGFSPPENLIVLIPLLSLYIFECLSENNSGCLISFIAKEFFATWKDQRFH